MNNTHAIITQHLGKRYYIGKKQRVNLLIQTVFPRYGFKNASELWAINDINLNVEQGEVLGIIGKNGAGKTTLLKVLGRITAPTVGRAWIKGRVFSLLEVGSGMQPELSGRDNIYMNAAFYGIKRQEVNALFDDIVEFAEIEQFIDTPVRHYSSGMYLRLAFSMAINLRPDVLLADEVLAVGDISFQKRCLQRMEQIGKSGVTVLFVSHDMNSIRRMCTRCIWLDFGKIKQTGKPEGIIKAYQEYALSGGSGDSNVIVKDEGGYQNKYLEVVEVGLFSSAGEQIGAAKASENFFIKTTFKIFGKNVKLNYIIDLFCEDTLVLRTGLSELVNISSPGVYEAYVKIPKKLLADREYTVNALPQVIAGDSKYPIEWHRALAFRVFYDKQSGSDVEIFNYHRNCLINPELKWEFTKAT